MAVKKNNWFIAAIDFNGSVCLHNFTNLLVWHFLEFQQQIIPFNDLLLALKNTTQYFISWKDMWVTWVIANYFLFEDWS